LTVNGQTLRSGEGGDPTHWVDPDPLQKPPQLPTCWQSNNVGEVLVVVDVALKWPTGLTGGRLRTASHPRIPGALGWTPPAFGRGL
jgi:hypothetical protein